MSPINLIVSYFQIVGYTDFPSRLPTQASTLYANNISKLLLSAGEKGHYHLNMEDEVIRGSIVHQDGALMWPPPVPKTPPPPSAPTKPKEIITAPAKTPWQSAVQETGLVTGIEVRIVSCTINTNYCEISFLMFVLSIEM